MLAEEEKTLDVAKRRGLGLVLRGMCMGTADVIPGVSGGTVALIMGIYDELVGTIASIDGRVLQALLRGRIAEVLRLVNAGFLVPLLAGIAIAIASFAKLITYLLTTHPQPVWGFFSGLILASALYVARQVEGGYGARVLAFIALGTIFGYGITSLVPVETGTESYKFVLAGMIAICAMILPGISGSFILVLLGMSTLEMCIHPRVDKIYLKIYGMLVKSKDYYKGNFYTSYYLASNLKKIHRLFTFSLSIRSNLQMNIFKIVIQIACLYKFVQI